MEVADRSRRALSKFGMPKLLASTATSIALIAALLALSWFLIQLLGGTSQLAPRWFHLPILIAILIAAWRFGLLGALVTAGLAGILAGPLALADVGLEIAQPFTDWGPRALGYIVVGLAMGAILQRLSRALQAELDASIKLREVAQLESTIVQSVSHEFRTPLTIIKGSARILEKGTLDAEKARELMASMLRATQRLEDLVGTVLAAGAVSIDTKASRLVSVSEVVEDASQRLIGLELGGPSRVKVWIEPAANYLSSDPGLLSLLIRLLVENALKFSPPDSEVLVGGIATDDGIEIRITDRGPGIPEDFLERAFNAFTQSDSSTTRTHEGLGMGLFAAHKIAGQLGANIQLLRRREVGTEVILTFPAGGVEVEVSEHRDAQGERSQPSESPGVEPKRSAKKSWMAHPLEFVFEAWRQPQGRHAVLTGLMTLLIGAGGALVYFTGGTELPYIHVMYVPIILAAFSYSVPGGIVAGVIAGLVVGPFMPIDVETGAMQQTEGWLFRMGFFVLVGVVVGQAQALLRTRLNRSQWMLEKVNSIQGAALRTFASTVALRDKPTGGHCERVGHNAALVARALGEASDSVEVAYWSGILHDLGKIVVPESILLKAGKLTEEEWEVMREHAAVGAGLIKQLSPDFKEIAEGVNHHHERWDGDGYPEGLRGERIPLASRIVAIVDVFEALNSERPYRHPIAYEEAMDEVRGASGSHFDPRIVAAFEDLDRRGLIRTADDPIPSPVSIAPIDVIRRSTGWGRSSPSRKTAHEQIARM